jgi:hypothetical protein
MKCEPQGIIRLDDVNARILGLGSATPLRLQLILTTIIAKFIFLVEAAFSCLQIPTYQKMLV